MTGWRSLRRNVPARSKVRRDWSVDPEQLCHLLFI
jgi:hypothetical protein